MSTIFFGGGTPTLLPAEHLGADHRRDRRALRAGRRRRGHHRGQPRDGDAGLPRQAARGRDSPGSRSGMQSAVPQVLEVLDRRHRPGRPEAAVAEARAAGFEHVNLDLIYGAPYETDADWQASLDAAIAAGPDHISAYALVVEEGTALARQVAAGVVPAPDDDVLADRYVHGRRDAAARPASTGTRCRTGRASDAARCRAQRAVLVGRELVGLRARARTATSAACAGGTSSTRRATPPCSRPATARPPAARRSTTAARLTERVMLGVRHARGPADCAELPTAGRACRPATGRLGAASTGLAADDGRVVLTQRGRLLADAVVRELLRLTVRPCGDGPRPQRVQVEDPHVHGVPVLQRRPQRAVQAVLEVDLAVPLHGVREQVAVEGRVLVEQLVERELALGGGQLVQPDRCAARRWPSRAADRPWSGYGRPSCTALKITTHPPMLPHPMVRRARSSPESRGSRALS